MSKIEYKIEYVLSKLIHVPPARAAVHKNPDHINICNGIKVEGKSVSSHVTTGAVGAWNKNIGVGSCR